MAGPANKRGSDAAAAQAAAEAAQAEALEREREAAAAALEAQRAAEEEALKLKRKQEQDELDVVAVGAVAHVIRRAFRDFYEDKDSVKNTARNEEEENESEETEVQAKEKQPEPEGVEKEESPFVALAQQRKEDIARKLEEKHSRARALLKFMEQRQKEASQADEKIAEDLSARGLVIKAQIPVGPTNLKLDEQELKAAKDGGEDFGEFTDSLLHARELVEEYMQRRKETSGNAPKGVTVSPRRTAAGEGSSEAGEHVGYLDTTETAKIRKEATLGQHKSNIAGVKISHAQRRSTSNGVAGKVTDDSEEEDATPSLGITTLTSETPQEKKTEQATMKAVEKRKNKAILERMQTKLDFVRNPRFAVPDQTRSRHAENRGPPPCFDVVPKPPITFTNYDIGGIYEQVVYVRNASGLARRARILPPGTIFFSIASITFPEESGLVAPGMHVELRVRFAPDSRADYKDHFIIQFETEQSVPPGSKGTPGAAGCDEMVVVLTAHREAPELTLPVVVRAQNTLVGGRSVTPLICKNLGGKARFWLMSEQAWSQLEYLQVATPGTSSARSAVNLLGSEQFRDTMVQVGPFCLTPNEIELDKGESLTFDLAYTPTGVGEQRERFIMVCDNCLVRTFQIIGRGCQVDIAATHVNDIPIDVSIAEMGPLDRLFFREDVLVNANALQTIVITNDTPLDVKYSWKILPRPQEIRSGKTTGKDEVMVMSLPPLWSPPFRIVPDNGVFALSSSKEFRIEFLPTEAREYACQAVLMINDIPACSMPGPSQMEHLKAAFQKREDPPTSPRAAAKAAARKLQDEMPGFAMQLHGRGRLGSFAIAPSISGTWVLAEDGSAQQPGASGGEAEQMLQISRKYSTSVFVKNQCDARVTVQWHLARLQQRHLAASGGPLALAPMSNTQPPSFELALSPTMVDLSPRGQHKVDITFTPLCTGAFSLSIPCRIVSGSGNSAPIFERWLLLEGRVAEAEIKIVTPEVDFGLVLVGASTEGSITIYNPSPIVRTHWRFHHLGGPGGEPSTGQHLQSSPSSKLHRSSSRDSVMSRQSTTSSASGNETERSLFTEREILPRAYVAFAPENGTLSPGETFTVKATCLAGSLPERFRGFFSCQAAPERNFSGVTTAGARAVVSARAEIQCPNVFLSTTKMALGTTYMGVEIHRTIEMINVSNLEAAFKFVEPEGVSKAYTVSFSPRQGAIHSKERLLVTISYTPRQVGRFTALLACSVRGLTAPLGLEVSSNHKGLVLSYELLASPSLRNENQIDVGMSGLTLPKSPKEIAQERGIALSDCDLEPETNPLSKAPKLAFGDSVPLGERRTLYLLIRNFSGIDALVDLEAKKFPADSVVASPPTSRTNPSSSSVGKHPRHNNIRFSPSSTSPTTHTKSKHKSKLSHTRSTRSLGSTKMSSFRPSPTNPRLSDTKDNQNRFQSENGRAYLRKKEEDVEDRQVLRSGRGVAFQLNPGRVHIPPWEQIVVRMTCFNNMSGTYVDDIVSRAAGIPPVFLHASVNIVGTPLVLDRNCVGLFFGKPVPAGRISPPLRQPTLHLGSVCVRSPSITRTLRVVNRGPQRARLKWKMVENGREDQLVTVTLRVDFSSRLQLRITPCDDSNSGAALPFAVEPPSAVIPAFSTTPFRITFEPPKDRVGASRALLLADAHWYEVNLEDSSDGNDAGPAELESDTRQEDSVNLPTHNSNNNPSAVAAGKAFAAVRMANILVRKKTSTKISTPASSYSPKCVRVLLATDVIDPELSIDKPRELLQHPESLQPQRTDRSSKNDQLPLPQLLAPYHIKFTTWSTLLTTAAAQHEFHQREIYLVNRLESRVTFRLECEGPFAVAQADSLAPRHPLSMADLPPAHRRSTAQGESYMFMLPPQMSVRIDLRFLPSPSLSSGSSVSNSKPKTLVNKQEQPLHAQLDGELRVKFSTRSVQIIRLAAVVLRPAIVVSPSVFFFGRVHLSASRSVVLRAGNPTAVPARFTVQHVPRPKPVSRAQQHEMRLHHAHLLDEPEVFTFSIRSGELRGPTTTLKSAGGYLPTTDSTRDLLGEKATTTHPLVHAPLEIRVEFHPRDRQRYKSRFRFVVEHGRAFEVVLEGVGHLDEVDDPRDGDRPLVRVKELQHSFYIFRGDVHKHS